MNKSSYVRVLLLVLSFLMLLSGCGEKQTAFEPDTDTTETNETEEIPEMTELFDCEAQKLDASLSGEALFDLYVKELENGKKNGYTPVIVVADDTLTEFVNSRYTESAGSAEDYISSTLSKDHSNGKEYLEKEYDRLKTLYGDEIIPLLDGIFDEWLADPQSSKHAENIPPLDSFAGIPYLLKIPTDKPSNIPAWIPFGGWNECPDTDDLISAFTYWNEKYGACPMIITHDVLVMYIEKPIADENEAVAAAKELVAFCDELALGYASPDVFATMVYNGDSWYFWWD